MNEIEYTSQHPESYQELFVIYEQLGWGGIGLSELQLEQMCKQSWHAVYAYVGGRMAGMGRVISDGIITGLICGLCIHPDFQGRRIGTSLLEQLVQRCRESNVIPQLMCKEELVDYYSQQGFQSFAIGMSYRSTS